VNQVHIDRIDQRRRYLEKRIDAKRSVGWETVYDESEHAALAWALEQLRPTPAAATFSDEHDTGADIPGGGAV
jgi:hypothetical protein